MINVNEYAKAFFELSLEDSELDSRLAELCAVKELLTENPDYVKLLDTPALAKEEKISLIDEAFSSLSEPTENLLKLLSERHSVHAFPKLAECFSAMCDNELGIVRVEVVTAVPLTEEQTAALTEKLAKKLSKTVVLKNTTDRSILGGVKLRYLGIQLDGSVKTRLSAFEKSLKATVI